jgi:hypothetical protein
MLRFDTCFLPFQFDTVFVSIDRLEEKGLSDDQTKALLTQGISFMTEYEPDEIL